MNQPEPIGLHVDPEFASLCPELTEDEQSYLRQSLLQDGCLNPILYWDHGGRWIIVDGHNRYALCLANDIPYTVESVPIKTRSEAMTWIARIQLGRRNLSEVQKQHLRGRLHLELKARTEAVKAAAENPPAQELCDTDVTHPAAVQFLRPVTQVAKETGVSERQVHRDTAFASALNRLAAKSPALREAALAGEIAKKDAATLADAPQDVLDGITEQPPASWRGCARSAASGLRLAGDPAPKSGRPIIDIRALVELDRAAGAVTRAKTAALEACGGQRHAWAFRHHEVVREILNQLFDAILAWQKEAQDRSEGRKRSE
jgi:hypothetical protein